MSRAASASTGGGGFQHEAFFYRDLDQYAAVCGAFIREGASRGEPVLVVVDEAKAALLRSDLGPTASRVEFRDMADVGANPARIIPAWRDFVEANQSTGRRLWGIGEPIWPQRPSAEMVECELHESLLNLAFGGAPDFRLICPYDASALDPEVLERAHRTHPHIRGGDGTRPSAGYAGIDAIEAGLSVPPATASEMVFDGQTLAAARFLVEETAARAGLDPHRARDLVIAANELATNSVRHGGGAGRLMAWSEPDRVLCEVADRGWIDQPLAGRVRPAPALETGRGLWLANQLCDLVQIRSSPEGSRIRLHMLLQPPSGPS